MGPFYNDTFSGRMKLNQTLNVLNSAKGISFREEVSLKRMIELGLDKSRVSLTSDYAFLLTKNKNSFFEILRPYIVVTLRQHNYKSIDGESHYLKNIKTCCDQLHSKYGVDVLVVPHVKGPNSFENDIIITKEFEKLTNGLDYYKYDYNYYSATELITLYSNAEILIGTRFHSVIFGLITNVPSFAISYSGYKANIVKQFQLDRYMISIEDLATHHCSRFNDLVKDLYEHRVEARKLIEERMPFVLQAILNDDAFLTLRD
ncbi:polysaccharide pyruvyl transferase family protein [Enterococcus diestrammenae]|uniref:polysaccharide pyruvyl transferase family protein n=1 Tax=Enterococcus TaxID=1350 RepID=UPI001379A15E|nr:polysaccharide pyruvyl transferase family protein [Enterococcus diestrammenae]